MKKVVTFGEIMLRLAPQGFLRFSQASNFALPGAGHWLHAEDPRGFEARLRAFL